MKYSYDGHADALYVEVSSGCIARQRERDDGVIVDLDADGQLVGIDVMRPGAGWDVQGLANDFHLSEPDTEFLETLASVSHWWKPVGNPVTYGGNCVSMSIEGWL